MTRSLATGAYGLGLFLLIVNFLVCGGILKVILTADTEKETVEFVAYTISTIFTPIIVVVSLRLYWHRLKFQWREKFKSCWKENQLINSLIVTASLLGIFLLITLITCEGGIFASILGTSTETGVGAKKETIKFIALGIGGILAAIGAIALSRRASAQIENNKLIEKGHIDERFKSATENLGNRNPMVRISAFYQFYYLAKDQQDSNFKKSVFEILCSCLRSMPRNKSHSTEEDGKEYPTAECQTLLNILFDSKYCAVFDGDGYDPDLQRVCLTNADLSYAKLSDANFSDADLSNARLPGANLSRAGFWKTNLSNAWLLDANLSDARPIYANLSNAWLMNANLTGAHCLYANLSKANLSNAILSNANLSRANLSNAILSNAQLLCANLSDTNLLGVRLLDANLSGANLSGVDLSNANLSGANFMAANLIGANLPSADLSSANFLGTNLSSANLSGANLSGANLSGANLSSANLQQTQLKDVNLMDVFNIKNADFRGAKIGNRPITGDDIPTDQGEYYADWNPPPDEQGN